MTTKQRIITIATMLLKQKGIHGWSYDDIATKIGIKKASIHYYFPTKEDLIQEVLTLYIKELMNRLLLIKQTSASVTQKLKAFMECYRENYVSENELCLCTILAAELQCVSPAIEELLKNFFTQATKFVKDILEEGAISKEFKANSDSDLMACVIINFLQGMLLTGKLLEKEEKRQFDLCMMYILHLISV